MEDFEKIFPKELYHSYVVEGNPDKTTKKLVGFLKNRGEIENQSPNLLIQTYESFTMKDSGQIKEWHSQLAFGQGKKICIIATKFINHEAEESLLKIIEEPGRDTHFFIVLPDSSVLLETILSRVQVVKDKDGDEKDEIGKIAESFISTKVRERMVLIDDFIKEKSYDENSGKLRYSAISLINQLEKIFYTEFKSDISNKKNKKVLEEIKKSRNFLKQPGSSVKYILQNLALII